MANKAFNKGHLIGRTLAKRRKMLGWTQHALAREVGLSVEKIVYIETDRTVPTAEELDSIRTAFRRRLKEVRAEVA